MLSHRFRRHSCIIGSHTEGHDRWTFDCVDCFAGFCFVFSPFIIIIYPLSFFFHMVPLHIVTYCSYRLTSTTTTTTTTLFLSPYATFYSSIDIDHTFPLLVLVVLAISLLIILPSICKKTHILYICTNCVNKPPNGISISFRVSVQSSTPSRLPSVSKRASELCNKSSLWWPTSE